ncbi:MAG: apolipoprotein N-acyltransferase [Verrucomicrobiales bacterium]|nr:apolipoprotein N-acyltransferase [Verrucomicrobiales bacterium]
MAASAITVAIDALIKPPNFFMWETLTSVWKLRKSKAECWTRSFYSGNIFPLIKVNKFGQTRWFLALMIGLAWALAFPEPRWSGLAWLVPGTLLILVNGSNAWRLFGLAFLASLVFRLVSLRFLLNIPHAPGAYSGWLALSLFSALFPAIWVSMCGVFFRCGLIKVQWTWFKRFGFGLFAAALWVGIEMIQARILGGYPWNFLGVTQFENQPLIQIASITGVYGVSFLIVWLSVSLLFAALQIRKKTANLWVWLYDIIVPCLFLMYACIFGFFRIGAFEEESNRVKFAVVQPSIPQQLIWEPGSKDARLDKLLELSELALLSKPDFLVWPESSAPITQEKWPQLMQMLQSANVPLIFGVDDVEKDPDSEKYNYYNSAAFMPIGGEAPVVYRKRRLVIFGEYIPFENIFPFMKYLSPIGGSFSSGKRSVQFPLNDNLSTMAPIICFEDSFPHGVREHVLPQTSLLVNLTNDGWFGKGSAQWQHAANAVFRTVENGIPMVRSCNNGLSCWIDSFGQVRRFFGEESEDIYGAGFIIFEIPILQSINSTFYNKYGDIFGWFCLGFSFFVVVGGFVKRRLHKEDELR